jgi:hypothetical protein
MEKLIMIRAVILDLIALGCMLGSIYLVAVVLWAVGLA